MISYCKEDEIEKYVARTGKIKMHTKFWSEKLKESDCLA